MRCCSSSAWTRISPIASVIGARSLCALTPRQPHAVGRARGDAEALPGGEPGYPGDLAGGDDDGDLRAPVARNLAVGEQVLERARAVEAERPHPVARPPRPDLEARGEPRGVERAVFDREVRPALACDLAGPVRGRPGDGERGGGR